MSPDEVTIRYASAPTRVDFAGGWTDVARYADQAGGCVVNCAVDLRVQVEVVVGGRNTMWLEAADLGMHVTIQSPAGLAYNGELDLHKAALNMLPVTGGVEVRSRSDAPPGSGLGGSGALDVALLAGLAHARDETFAADELAEMGYQLETGELGLEGGRQDQYAAALGGCHVMHFAAGPVRCEPLLTDGDALGDLGRCLVVVYTGQTHFSSATHRAVWEAFDAGRSETVDALHGLRDAARDAATAIRAADWPALGRAMDGNWRHQQRLDDTIATPRMGEIEAAVRAAGIWGLKATGAGAGGCFAVLVDPSARDAVAAAAVAAGASVLACRPDAVGTAVREEADAGRPGR